MKKFIIVGTYRTGSSAIAESIGLNPCVACGWEWTRAVPWWNKMKVTERALSGEFSLLGQNHQDHMLQEYRPGCSWLGYRHIFSSSPKWIIHPRFSPVLWIERLEGYLRWLTKEIDILIIHIIRRDAIDWLKSVYLSKRYQLYIGKVYPEDIKIKIPINEAVARLRSKEWIDSRLAVLTTSNAYMQINYEDLIANQDGVIMSVLGFLGCNQEIINRNGRQIFKQSKRQASCYISNYEELLKHLERIDLSQSRVGQH